MRMAISLPLGISVMELKLCNYDFGELAFFSALWNMHVAVGNLFIDTGRCK